jgi:hypothetical protein
MSRSNNTIAPSTARRVRATPAAAEAADLKSPTAADDTRIRETAYFLYEQRGHRSGHALEDWLEAEAQVRRGEKIQSARTRANAA